MRILRKVYLSSSDKRRLECGVCGTRATSYETLDSATIVIGNAPRRRRARIRTSTSPELLITPRH